METIKVEAYTDLGSQEDYMHWIQTALNARAEAENEILECVLGARAQGASWQTIGNKLGMSKQAAQKKYGRYEAIKPNTPLFKEPAE